MATTPTPARKPDRAHRGRRVTASDLADHRRYAIVDEAMMREGADKLATLHEAQRKMTSASGPDKSSTSQAILGG